MQYIARSVHEQPMKNKMTLTVGGGGDDGHAAKEVSTSSCSGDDTKLMPNINRRASLTSSQDSSSSIHSQKLSRRGLFRRQAARRRTGTAQRGSTRFNLSGRSIRSGSSTGRSVTKPPPPFKCSFSSSLDSNSNSISILDFGASQRALTAALDECARSCASLDDDVLRELQEEFEFDEYDGSNDNDGRGWRGANSKSKRRLLLSWGQDGSSFRSMRINNLNESTRSEGDLDDYVDSCGFLDWPSVANGIDGTIEEECTGQVKREEEELNIEDYEQSIDDSAHSSSLGQTISKKLSMFARRSSSIASAGSSHEGPMDFYSSGVGNIIGNMIKLDKTDAGERREERRSTMDEDSAATVNSPAQYQRKPSLGEWFRSRVSSLAEESCEQEEQQEAPLHRKPNTEFLRHQVSSRMIGSRVVFPGEFDDSILGFE
eukprot:scaffold16612_cov109-Skeletonema_dohrnii-CCMP3373.AAC.4